MSRPCRHTSKYGSFHSLPGSRIEDPCEHSLPQDTTEGVRFGVATTGRSDAHFLCGNFRAMGDASHPWSQSLSGAAGTSCTAPRSISRGSARGAQPDAAARPLRASQPSAPTLCPAEGGEGSSLHDSRCRRSAGATPTRSPSCNSFTALAVSPLFHGSTSLVEARVHELPLHQDWRSKMSLASEGFICREHSVASSLSASSMLEVVIMQGKRSLEPVEDLAPWSRVPGQRREAV